MKNRLSDYLNLIFYLLLAAVSTIISLMLLAPKTYAVPWDVKIRPGDVVCIYDISMDDPLADKDSSDSLKYWYRLPTGDQKGRWQLRPMVRDIQMRVLWPGFKVSAKDRDNQYWYSGLAVVIKGGLKSSNKTYPINKGENILMRNKGRTIIMNWQTLHFERVRLKKNPKGPRGCRRKYEQF
jgi:hypothetical protein